MSKNLNRINWSRNTEKAINGLLGILCGVTADRRLNEHEALFLDVWLRSNQHLSEDPDVLDLLDLIGDILSDGEVTQEELSDLNQLCDDIIQYREVDRFESEKQLNEFLGLLQGVTADGMVNPKELDFVDGWIRDHREVSEEWPIDVVLQRIKSIKDDGKITIGELNEFCDLLKSITGSRFDETGAADGSATEFLVNEIGEIDLTGRFCFTGTFVSGQRKKLQEAVSKLGGEVKRDVSAQLDYLVIGSIATRDWMYSSHGRKVEKAIKLQKDGVPLIILSEQSWLELLPDSSVL